MRKFWNKKVVRFYKQSAALIVVGAMFISIILPPFAQAKQYSSKAESFQLRPKPLSIKPLLEQQQILSQYQFPNSGLESYNQSTKNPVNILNVSKEEFIRIREQIVALLNIALEGAVNGLSRFGNSILQRHQWVLTHIRRTLFPYELTPAGIGLSPSLPSSPDRTDWSSRILTMSGQSADGDDALSSGGSAKDVISKWPLASLVTPKVIDAEAKRIIRQVFRNYNLGEIKDILPLNQPQVYQSRLMAQVTTTDGKSYVIKEYWEDKLALAVHFWMNEELVKNNFPTPRVYKNKNGTIRTRVGQFQYVVMDFVDADQGNHQLSHLQKIQAAKLLARFHAIFYGKKSPIKAEFTTHYDLYERIISDLITIRNRIFLRGPPFTIPESILFKIEPLFKLHLEQVFHNFPRLAYNELPKTYVHGDYKATNLFISHSEPTVGEIVSVIDHFWFLDTRIVDLFFIPYYSLSPDQSLMESLAEFTALYQQEAAALGIPLTEQEIMSIPEIVRQELLMNIGNFFRHQLKAKEENTVSIPEDILIIQIIKELKQLEDDFNSENTENRSYSKQFRGMVQNYTQTEQSYMLKDGVIFPEDHSQNVNEQPINSSTNNDSGTEARFIELEKQYPSPDHVFSGEEPSSHGSRRLSAASIVNGEKKPHGNRKWDKDKIVDAIKDAVKENPNLELNSNSNALKKQRNSPAMNNLYRAFMAVYSNNRLGNPIFNSWEDAVEAAGIDRKYTRVPKGRRKKTLTRDKILNVVRKAVENKLSLRPSVMRLTDQSKTPLGKELSSAYVSVMHGINRGTPLFNSWEEVVREAGGDIKGVPTRERWNQQKIVDVIQKVRRANLERKEKLRLNPYSIERIPKQRSDPLGGELFRAYAVVKSGIHFPSWTAALKAAGVPNEEFRFKSKRFWNKKKIIMTVKYAKKGGLRLNVGAVVSKQQRSAPLGAALYKAYRAVLHTIENDIDPLFESWEDVLIISKVLEKPNIEEVAQFIHKAVDAKLGLDVESILSPTQRRKRMGEDLFWLYLEIEYGWWLWSDALESAGVRLLNDQGKLYPSRSKSLPDLKSIFDYIVPGYNAACDRFGKLAVSIHANIPDISRYSEGKILITRIAARRLNRAIKELLTLKSSDDTAGGNWIWFYEWLKNKFFSKLTLEEYNRKLAWVEDMISFGVGSFIMISIYLSGNHLLAVKLSYSVGRAIFVGGHESWFSNLFGSRAPPEHLKAAKEISIWNLALSLPFLLFVQDPLTLAISLAAISFITHQQKNTNFLSQFFKDSCEFLDQILTPNLVSVPVGAGSKYPYPLAAMAKDTGGGQRAEVKPQKLFIGKIGEVLTAVEELKQSGNEHPSLPELGLSEDGIADLMRLAQELDLSRGYTLAAVKSAAIFVRAHFAEFSNAPIQPPKFLGELNKARSQKAKEEERLRFQSMEIIQRPARAQDIQQKTLPPDIKEFLVASGIPADHIHHLEANPALLNMLLKDPGIARLFLERGKKGNGQKSAAVAQGEGVSTLRAFHKAFRAMLKWRAGKKFKGDSWMANPRVRGGGMELILEEFLFENSTLHNLLLEDRSPDDSVAELYIKFDRAALYLGSYLSERIKELCRPVPNGFDPKLVLDELLKELNREKEIVGRIGNHAKSEYGELHFEDIQDLVPVFFETYRSSIHRAVDNSRKAFGTNEEALNHAVWYSKFKFWITAEFLHKRFDLILKYFSDEVSKIPTLQAMIAFDREFSKRGENKSREPMSPESYPTFLRDLEEEMKIRVLEEMMDIESDASVDPIQTVGSIYHEILKQDDSSELQARDFVNLSVGKVMHTKIMELIYFESYSLPQAVEEIKQGIESGEIMVDIKLEIYRAGIPAHFEIKEVYALLQANLEAYLEMVQNQQPMFVLLHLWVTLRFSESKAKFLSEQEVISRKSAVQSPPPAAPIEKRGKELRAKKLSEEESHELMVSYGKILETDQMFEMAPIKVGDQLFGVESYFSNKNGLRLLRIGSLIFIEAPGNPLNERDMDPHTLEQRLQIVKGKLGEFYPQNQENVFFTRPSRYENNENTSLLTQLSPHSMISIAAILANSKRFLNETVLDFGSGDGLLSRVALRLGASQVILFEGDPVEVNRSRVFMAEEGWQEKTNNGKGNYQILVEDMRKLNFLKKFKQDSRTKNARIGIANLGTPGAYGHADKNVVDLILQLSDMELFISGGHTSNYSAEEAALLESVNRFKKSNFLIEQYEYYFLHNSNYKSFMKNCPREFSTVNGFVATRPPFNQRMGVGEDVAQREMKSKDVPTQLLESSKSLARIIVLLGVIQLILPIPFWISLPLLLSASALMYYLTSVLKVNSVVESGVNPNLQGILQVAQALGESAEKMRGILLQTKLSYSSALGQVFQLWGEEVNGAEICVIDLESAKNENENKNNQLLQLRTIQQIEKQKKNNRSKKVQYLFVNKNGATKGEIEKVSGLSGPITILESAEEAVMELKGIAKRESFSLRIVTTQESSRVWTNLLGQEAQEWNIKILIPQVLDISKEVSLSLIEMGAMNSGIRDWAESLKGEVGVEIKGDRLTIQGVPLEPMTRDEEQKIEHLYKQQA